MLSKKVEVTIIEWVYLAAGVDIISVGALTHQIKSLDIGLDLLE